jgi:hypothetical protein
MKKMDNGFFREPQKKLRFRHMPSEADPSANHEALERALLRHCASRACNRRYWRQNLSAK